jgi:hypothetical protein
MKFGPDWQKRFPRADALDQAINPNFLLVSAICVSAKCDEKMPTVPHIL